MNYLGARLIQCYPSSFVFESSVYDVPTQYHQLLGTTRIKLTPGSIRKSAQQSTFQQTFVFEINSSMSFKKHGEVFELIGPIKINENIDHNCALQTFPSEMNDPNYAELNEDLRAHLPRRWSQWYIQDVQKQWNRVSACSISQKGRNNKCEDMGLPSRSPNSHQTRDPLALHHKPAW